MNFLNKGRIYFIVLYFSRIYKERVEDDQEEVEGSIGGDCVTDGLLNETKLRLSLALS